MTHIYSGSPYNLCSLQQTKTHSHITAQSHTTQKLQPQKTDQKLIQQTIYRNTKRK